MLLTSTLAGVRPLQSPTRLIGLGMCAMCVVEFALAEQING